MPTGEVLGRAGGDYETRLLAPGSAPQLSAAGRVPPEEDA
jgi:hypothetical protein